MQTLVESTPYASRIMCHVRTQYVTFSVRACAAAASERQKLIQGQSLRGLRSHLGRVLRFRDSRYLAPRTSSLRTLAAAHIPIVVILDGVKGVDFDARGGHNITMIMTLGSRSDAGSFAVRTQRPTPGFCQIRGSLFCKALYPRSKLEDPPWDWRGSAWSAHPCDAADPSHVRRHLAGTTST